MFIYRALTLPSPFMVSDPSESYYLLTLSCPKSHSVVLPSQESMDNSPSLFDYELDGPYNDLINDFDPYLEYGKGYQNRTAFEDAFYG